MSTGIKVALFNSIKLSTYVYCVLFVFISSAVFANSDEMTSAQRESEADNLSSQELQKNCHDFLNGFRDRLSDDFSLKSSHFKMQKHCLTGAAHLIGPDAGRECVKVKKNHLSELDQFKKYREDLFTDKIEYKHGKFMAVSMIHRNGRDAGELSPAQTKKMWKKFEDKQGKFIQNWFQTNGDTKVPGWKKCFKTKGEKLVFMKKRSSDSDSLIREVLRPDFNRKNSRSVECRNTYRAFRQIRLGRAYAQELRKNKKRDMGKKKLKNEPKPWMLAQKKPLEGLSQDKQLRGIATSYQGLEDKMNNLEKMTRGLEDNDLYKLLVFKDRFLAEGGNPKCLKRPGVSRITRLGEVLVEDVVPFVNMYYASEKHRGVLDANESGVAGVTDRDVQRGRLDVAGAGLVSTLGVLPMGKVVGPSAKLVGGGLSKMAALRGTVKTVQALNVAQRKVAHTLIKNSGVQGIEVALLKQASRYPVATAAGRAKRQALQVAAEALKSGRIKALRATGRLTAEEAEQLAEATVKTLQESGWTPEEIYAFFQET